MRVHYLTPYYFIWPGFLLAVVTILVPNILTLFFAFTNYSLYHFEDYNFIGFANFIHIFLGVEARRLLLVSAWTIFLAAGSVILSLLLGLALALILHKHLRSSGGLLKTLLILPWALPNFITILVWHGLLNTNFGFVNHVLSFCGITPIPWLENAAWAKGAVLLVTLWLGFPFMMSVCLGALKSIPEEIYEAAVVDGATSWEKFKFITLPLLQYTLLPVLISSFAFQFNQFNVIYLLTEGGPPVLGSPAGATDILVTYAYKLAFDQFRFGLSCAYGVLIFLVVSFLSIGNFIVAGGIKDA